MTTDFLLRLILATFAGAAVGAERELRGHAAGVRTHALVAVGAALFTIAGLEGSTGINADPMRVAAQVVSGIGFVGAGAILQDNSGVKGLTTASTIWVSGALGVISAIGDVLLAFTGLGVVVAILVSRKPLRLLMRVLNRTTEIFVGIEYELGYGTIGPILRVVEKTDSDILGLTMADNENRRIAEITIRTPAAEFQSVLDVLHDLEHRAEIHDLRVKSTHKGT